MMEYNFNDLEFGSTVDPTFDPANNISGNKESSVGYVSIFFTNKKKSLKGNKLEDFIDYINITKKKSLKNKIKLLKIPRTIMESKSIMNALKLRESKNISPNIDNLLTKFTNKFILPKTNKPYGFR